MNRAAHALLALALIVCAAACEAGGGPASEPRIAPRAAEDAVARGTLRERLLLTGELRAERSVELRVPRTSQWQLSIRWMEEDGALVEEGARLIEFDTTAFVSELEARRLRIRQAELDLASQRATSVMARADKEFELERQRALLERSELLAGVPRDLLPLRDWQERQLALDRARVAHERAEDDLRTHQRTASLDLEVKRIEIDKLRREVEASEEAIRALVLTAPRGGILLVADHQREGRKLVAGDMVHPGWPALSIPDLSVMRVDAHLSDVDDGRVVPGMRVSCVLDAYPDLVFEGTVREVSPVAHEIGRRSLRRAFLVAIDLDRTDPERMRPGMSVKVELLGAEVAGALLAPRAGLDLAGDEPQAILSGGSRARVVLGPCDAHRCVIEEGLSEGQRLRVGVAR